MKKSDIVEVACKDLVGVDEWQTMTKAERDTIRVRMGWVVDKVAEMLLIARRDPKA